MFKLGIKRIITLITGTYAAGLVLFCGIFLVSAVSAKDSVEAYFSNDSLNGLKISDAYETHNMGLIYSNDAYYLKLDLGLVSPDMHAYRNEYRKANRSFGELVSLEIGQPYTASENFRFYAQIKGAGEFGIDRLQDFAHKALSLQEVNNINDLIRMPNDAWVGFGLRNEFEISLMGLKNLNLNLDGFVGSDTTFLKVRFTKEFYRPLLTYDLSLGGRLVAYDRVISAPPIIAEERNIIPEISFGISYDTGPYSIFLKDSFSLPSIKADSDLYGVLSMGASYDF